MKAQRLSQWVDTLAPRDQRGALDQIMEIHLSFAVAVRSVLTQYVGFSGRARRSEYWWYLLFTVAVGLVTGLLDQAAGNQAISSLTALALILPGLAVAVRRLHDTGRSGWSILLALIPLIGPIVLVVFMCQDSEPDNFYGPSPKQGQVYA